MRILFTGGSSFTGYWFVRELARAGHAVTAVFRGAPDSYTGGRALRVAGLTAVAECRFQCTFGDAAFLDLVRRAPGWDLLCHHAADVTDYKSPQFDVVRAIAANTRELAMILDELATGGCRRVLLTGSVFAAGEGAGSEGLPAFSPYGLSKGLTTEVFRYHAARCHLQLGHFVIPNPFGPHEEPRFTTYLARTWLAGQTAAVNTPDYVRDNIHVSLLAKAYAAMASQLPARAGFTRYGPSGYVESQGAFAQRFAVALRPRLGVPCELDLRKQTDFSEPRVRINTDVPNHAALGWDEDAAWDELAEWYRQGV